MIKRQTNETLRNDIWRACDILRRDNNVGGVVQYTEHLAWLLFLKFLDEEEKERLAMAALGESEHYEPVLQGDLAWDAWASPEKLATWKVDDLIQFVRGRLLPGLSTLTGSPLARTIAHIFSDESVGDQNVVRNVPVCASGYNLKDVLTIINSIRFDSDDDIFTISQVYEDLLERMGAENCIAGEFYTPRSVIRFMVDVIAPQIGETVYDPACGSAGFLAAAYEFMQPQERTSDDRETLQHKTFFGQEKKGVSALLGTMNMVLHRVATPNITRTNSLEDSVKGSVSGRFDVVLTNPPFGGAEGGHIQQNFPVKSNVTESRFCLRSYGRRGGCTTRGFLDLSEVKTIRIAESEVSRYCLQPGDLLLTGGGDFDKLGRGAVWSNEIEPCIHQNHIFAVRFDRDVMQPEFAEYEMQSWHAKRYYLGVTKKATNLATINRTQLAAFPLKFPDLNEQRRIVAYLDSARQQVAELQRIQGQDRYLMAKMEQSILYQAFRGEM